MKPPNAGFATRHASNRIPIERYSDLKVGSGREYVFQQFHERSCG